MLWEVGLFCIQFVILPIAGYLRGRFHQRWILPDTTILEDIHLCDSELVKTMARVNGDRIVERWTVSS